MQNIKIADFKSTMALSPQHLAEVLEYLRENGLAGGHEKRRAARIQVQAKITVGLLSEDGRMLQSFTSLTRDVSLMGVGLMQGVLVKQNQHVIVCLPRIKAKPLYMRTLVCHCRVLADGLYAVGAEFVEEASQGAAESMEHYQDVEQRRIQGSILN